MKINIKKIGIGIAAALSISFVLFKFNLINVEKLITINIIKHEGHLDEVWDFEKIIKPDKSGYYNWAIGLKAGDVTAVGTASGTVVTLVGNKELNMNYKSMEDYYNQNGNILFRSFIEGYDIKQK